MGMVVGIALIWFIIEMLLWYLIAQFISGWWVFGWFVLAGFVGFSLIKKGGAVLSPMAQQMKAGMMPVSGSQPNDATMTKSIAIVISGILLAIPGLLSDVLALLALLPPVQNKVKKIAVDYMQNNQQKMMDLMAKQMGGKGPFGAGGFNAGNTNVVDGTATRVNKPTKNITPANDE